MANQVDDIKRVGDDDQKKKREIVLRFIEEAEHGSVLKKSEPSAGFSFAKLVDSLAARKSASKPSAEVPAPKAPREDAGRAKVMAEIVKADTEEKKQTEAARAAEVEAARQKKLAAEKLEKEAAAKQAAQAAEEQRKFEAERLKQVKEQALAEKKAADEKAVAQRKRQSEILKKEASQAKEEKRKEKTQKNREVRRIGFEKLKAKLLATGRFRGLTRLFSFLGSFAVVLLSAYFIFCLILYTFSPDNQVVRLATRIFPVPALITDIGIINYYDYLDAKRAQIEIFDHLSGAAGDKIAGSLAKSDVLKEKVMERLAQNYGLAGRGYLPAELEEKLSYAVVLDPEVNYRALVRARELKKITSSGSEMGLAAQINNLTVENKYFTTQAAAEKFGTQIMGLGGGEAGRLIIRPEGYYLVQLIGWRDNLIGLRYILIKAKTLSEVISEQLDRLKVIILVN